MKEYYYEQYQMATLKLEIARIGYERKMKTLATKLLTHDESYHQSIIKCIVELRKAIDEMLDSAIALRKKYEAELDKEAEQDAKVHE